MLVLHVVDRLTGGVPSAVRSYISSTAHNADHVVLSPQDDSPHSLSWNGVGASHLPLDPGSTPRAIRSIRLATEELQPDVVHAHSSFAGAWTRIALLRHRTPVVYTPHCFGFARRDVSRLARLVFLVAEQVLSFRTTVLAACGPGEEITARKMIGSQRFTTMIPNVSSVPPRPAATIRNPSTDFMVGTLGRVSAQKDPRYYASVIRLIQTSRRNARSKWIGGGDDTSALDALRDHTTTGWVAATGVPQALSELDLYIHTARWEGFPIAVLDAHSTGLPILVRAIDAFPELDPSLTIEHGLDAMVASLDHGTFEDWSETNQASWGAYLSGNNSGSQSEALMAAWLRAADRTGSRS